MTNTNLVLSAQRTLSDFREALPFPATFGMEIVYKPEWSPKYIATRGPDDRHFMIYRTGDHAGEHVVLVIDGGSQRISWEQTTPWPFGRKTPGTSSETTSDQGFLTKLLASRIEKHYAKIEAKEHMSRHARQFLEHLRKELLFSGDPDLRRLYYFLAESLSGDWIAKHHLPL